jgi:hypothetical protein
MTNEDQWMGLCELASNEQDQDKLGALFEGMLCLLEDHKRGMTLLPIAGPTTHHRWVQTERFPHYPLEPFFCNQH